MSINPKHSALKRDVHHTFSKENMTKNSLLNRFFKKIALFFSRVGLLFKYRVWYSKGNIEKLVQRVSKVSGDGASNVYDPEIKKVLNVLTKLSHFMDFGEEEKELLKLQEDELPQFKLIKKMSRACTRLLFQIHADEYGANNKELEGYNQKETLAYLSEYLTKRKQENLDLYGLDESIVEEVALASKISKAGSLKSFVRLIQTAMNNNPNQKLLLPGGWTGKPSGHAMNYEVIPGDDGKVTFRIFNLGAGSEGVIDPNDYKTKAPPYTDFVGVDQDKFLDEHFLQAIYELNNYAMLPGFKTKTEFSADDIYVCFKELLKPTGTQTPDESTFKTTQRSGVCSWRSLMAFMTSRMSKDEYKRFSCDIKMQSLMHRKWSKISDKSELALINKAQGKMARKIDRLAQEKIVGTQYLYRSNELLSVAKTNLKKHRIKLYKSPIASRKKSTDWLKEPIKKDYLISKSTALFKQKLEVHTDQRSAIDDTLIESVTHLSINEVISRSKQSIEEGNYQVAHIALQKLIMHLKKDELNNQDVDTVSSELGELAKLYFDTCFLVPEADIIHAERVVALERLLYLQTAIVENSNLLLTKEKPFSCGTHVDLFLNPNQAEVIKKVHYGFLYIGFSRNAAVGKSSSISFTDYNPREELAKLLPETYNKLVKSDARYAELPKQDQMALLFMSNETPIWFQNLRNTALSLHYLSKEPVANPLNGDVKSFPINLNLKKEYGDIKVIISIKEVTGDVLTDYPQLVKGRKNNNFHFARNYRSFNNKEMENFIKYIVPKYRSLKEKKLLASTVDRKEIKFSNEHFKELAHIFTHHDKIDEAFEYFFRHPEKLSDPDYQTLFEICLFNNDSLKSHLGDYNKFSNKINQFLTEQLDHSFLVNEVQKSVFLIRLSRLLHLYHSDVKDQSDELHQLVNREGLLGSEKSAVYAELIASLGKKSELNDQELESLIIGSAYVAENPVQSKWMMPQQNKEIREAQVIHSKSIVNLLQSGERNRILNQIGKEIFPEFENMEWEEINEGKSPRFISSNGSIIFDVITQRMYAQDIDTTLPPDILAHPHFMQNFKGVTTARHGANDVFTFTHKGCETLVKIEHNKVIIEQKRDGSWYRFIPKDAFVFWKEENKLTPLRSRHLLQNFTHWQSIKKPNIIYLLDPKTGKKEYMVRLRRGFIQKIQQAGQRYKLTRPTNLLKRFEDENYIQEWSKGFLATHVELPRFNLSFELKGRKWVCEQFQKEGFFIAKEQSIPLMGIYKSYLVLENGAGKKKILIPKYAIKKPEEMNAIKPDYVVDKNLEAENNDPQTYLSFDLKKNGLLENKSNTAKYYLASLLTTAQEYNKAALYLRKYGPKLTRYTDDEVESLKRIQNMGEITGDTSGDGLALQSYAMYLLLQNSLKHDVNISKLSLGNEIKIYKNYLAHLKHATVLKLTREEELFLLKTILNHTFDPTLIQRLSSLDESYAQKIQIPVEKIRDKRVPQISILSLPLKGVTGNGKVTKMPSFNKMLLTRINTYLFSSPLEMFKRIKNATPKQKEWLQDALTFGKKAKGAAFSFIFEDIMNHPENYKDPPKLNKDKKWAFQADAEKWWKEIKDIANENTREARAQVGNDQKQNKIEIPLKDAARILESLPAIQPVELTLESFKGFDESCASFFTTSETKGVINKNHKNWLDSEKNNPASNEPLYKNEIDRLTNDTKYQKSKVQHSINELDKIKANLYKDREKNQNTLLQLEVELIELANQSAESHREKIIEKLQIKGGSRKVLTINDLLISFAKNDPASIVRINPNISANIETIYKKVGSYLLLATHEQQRERGLKTFSKLEGSEEDEREEYEHLLGLDLLTKRFYDPNERPAYLVFEYYADLLMREQQVDKLKEFLDNGETNHVMEMIMGSGKSKVLLPLLGLLRADGNSISMVIVPQPLFEDVSSNTQRVLYDAFSQSLKSLNFHRNTQFDQSSLERIKDDLQEIIRKKECLIITSKSIQCFLLKFIEESHKQNGVLNDELVLMQDILQMLTEGHPIIDEVDTVLNVLHEVCFSTGKQLNPKDEEIQLIADMYKILYLDKKINALIRIESNPKLNKSAEELTEINYHGKPKERLAKKCLKLSPFDEINQEDKNLALDYLLHRNPAAAQNYFNAQNEDLQNNLALAAEQISNFLPHTLTRTCEEKYGLDFKNGGSIAIPYAAANTPSEGSQFANPYITMNYTFQYYIKKGISKEILINEIERLQSMSMKEMKETGVGARLEDTEGWKLFQKLSEGLDIPLFKYNETHIALLSEKINSSVDQKLLFIQLFVLPQLELYENKLSCNPQNLIAFFKQASGFTGTLWNQQSMHSKLEAMPDPGIDTKTLNLLWKNSKDEVHIVTETTPLGMIKELAESGIQYDLISDAGGYFKEGGNAEVARELSDFTGKPVVYYDKQNRQAIIEDGEELLLAESSVPVDQRATFLDQSHTTGSDTLQKRDAIGLVTISRGMLLRDLLQSVWRLRGLDKSQSVKFIISNEIKGIICQQLNKEKDSDILFEDILRFTIINQTKQQGIDNFKGLLQEINSLPQQLLFKVMLNSDYTEEQRELTIEALEKYWIKSSSQEPKDIFGVLSIEEDNALVVEAELAKFNDKVDELRIVLPFFENEFDEMKIKAESISKNLEGKLPEHILSPVRDIDDDQTVEVQQETEQEVQVQLELHQIDESESIKLGITEGELTHRTSLDEKVFPYVFFVDDRLYEGFGNNTPYFDLKVYMETSDELREFADCFEGVSLTLNVLQWPEKNPKISDLKLFGSRRTPFHQIQFKDGKALIVSNEKLDSYYGNDRYNLGFGFEDPDHQLSREQQNQIVKIKFLNGESSYSKEEAEILKTWIQDAGADKMLHLLQYHILAGMSDKTSAYNNNSTLAKIFTELR